MLKLISSFKKPLISFSKLLSNSVKFHFLTQINNLVTFTDQKIMIPPLCVYPKINIKKKVINKILFLMRLIGIKKAQKSLVLSIATFLSDCIVSIPEEF